MFTSSSGHKALFHHMILLISTLMRMLTRSFFHVQTSNDLFSSRATTLIVTHKFLIPFMWCTQWVSHLNHRGNICGVDFIWLLNPNRYRKLLKTSWSEAVFGMFKVRFCFLNISLEFFICMFLTLKRRTHSVYCWTSFIHFFVIYTFSNSIDDHFMISA